MTLNVKSQHHFSALVLAPFHVDIDTIHDREPYRAVFPSAQEKASPSTWMVSSRTLLSHVSVKTKMQQSMNLRCVVCWSWI